MEPLAAKHLLFQLLDCLQETRKHILTNEKAKARVSHEVRNDKTIIFEHEFAKKKKKKKTFIKRVSRL